MIKRFNELNGLYIEKIYGQERLAYAMSDSSDLYDLIEFAERGGYQGSIIKFYDLKSGAVYTPFEKKRDVMYGRPVFSEGFYYFLQADYAMKSVTLYKYLPEKILEAVTEFNIKEVNLYNLMIIGEKIHVISQDGNEFKCYYPEKITLPLGTHDSVTLISEDRIYIESWVEEGWDDAKDCASDDYKYYDKVIIKDFAGNIISEEVGSIYQADDGTYWIA